MPWNNETGGSGSGNSGGPIRGPWGRGGGGGNGGGGQPPDLEELLRRSRERLRGFLPNGQFTSGSIAVVVLGFVLIWLATGIYRVDSSEQGVVMRFGQWVATTPSGIHYHLPWPFETVETPDVTGQKQINIGYRTPSDNDEAAPEDVDEEALMLTGDENIVDINFTVTWSIKDAGAYLFNVEDPDQAIKAVAESAMREVVGQSEIELIQTRDRESVQARVRDLMQKTLDHYGAGVYIFSVNLQKVDPPKAVIPAYRDVQAARADQERARNEAEAYANKIIPEARGRASKIVQDAQAYKQQVIAEASGEAKRFLSVYEEYRKAPEVTRRRMYIETMSNVLAPMNKVIIDDSAKVLPFLPLPALTRNNLPETVTVTAPPPDKSEQVTQGRAP
ncbi:MAG: FtsH protease activity modulator HflK [Proteobacteria bacterium]|nr:FtsH protease activity modulator HflK [Pseudomonadota bacterium]